MTNTKHTPAPWLIEGQTIWNPETKRAIYATGLKPIDERDEIGQANARLIAAAPELLEALKSFVECGYIDLSANEWIYEEAKKAINKAKGK